MPARNITVLSPMYSVTRQVILASLRPAQTHFKSNARRMDYGLIPCLIVDDTTDLDHLIGYWTLGIYNVRLEEIRVYDGFGNANILERFPALRKIFVGASQVLSQCHAMARSLPRLSAADPNSYTSVTSFELMPFAIAMLGQLFAQSSDDIPLQSKFDLEEYAERVVSSFRSLYEGLDLSISILPRISCQSKTAQHGSTSVGAVYETTDIESDPRAMPRRSVCLLETESDSHHPHSVLKRMRFLTIFLGSCA